jgi:hypothetical protein
LIAAQEVAVALQDNAHRAVLQDSSRVDAVRCIRPAASPVAALQELLVQVLDSAPVLVPVLALADPGPEWVVRLD